MQKVLKHKSLFLLLIIALLFFSSPVMAQSSNTLNYRFVEYESRDNNFAYIQQNISESEVYQKMIALQSQYPEGMPWTNDNEYTSRGYLMRDGQQVGIIGAGCVGFALILSDEAFGDAPIYQHNDMNAIRVGDILRVNNNSHSVIVLEVTPTELTIAEGNYNSSIHWGRKLSRSDLRTDYIWTRYAGENQPTPTPSQPSQTPSSTESMAIARIFNPATGEHLYTPDLNEVLVQVIFNGWKDEGVSWYAPASGSPVYRVFNPSSGDHLYTTDQYERDQLVANSGWRNDNNGNPLFYSGGSVNIFRLYNPATGRHLLTRDENEYNSLPASGWQQEGVKLNAAE